MKTKQYKKTNHKLSPKAPVVKREPMPGDVKAHDGKVVTRVQGKYMDAWVPTGEIVEEQPLTVTTKFPKLSLAVWRQCVGFNKWVVDTYGTEAMMSLFMSKDGVIVPEVFEQELLAGMSAKVAYESPANTKILNELRPHIEAPSMFWSTIHNHVDSSAFQSGTDAEDEKKLIGFHITIGNMKDAVLDLDARICGRFQASSPYQAFYPIETEKLIDCSELISQWKGLPAKVGETLVTDLVNENGDFEFPAVWRERVPPPRAATVYTPGKFKQGGGAWGARDQGGYGLGYCDEYDDWSYDAEDYTEGFLQDIKVAPPSEAVFEELEAECLALTHYCVTLTHYFGDSDCLQLSKDGLFRLRCIDPPFSGCFETEVVKASMDCSADCTDLGAALVEFQQAQPSAWRRDGGIDYGLGAAGADDMGFRDDVAYLFQLATDSTDRLTVREGILKFVTTYADLIEARGLLADYEDCGSDQLVIRDFCFAISHADISFKKARLLLKMWCSCP